MRLLLTRLGLASVTIASVSCGLLFGERDPAGPGAGGEGAGGAGGDTGAFVCTDVDGSPFTSFDQLTLLDLAVDADRVFFGGCALNAPERGLPDVPGASALFIASVSAVDLCDLKVQYLGACDASSRLSFSQGGEVLLAAWTRVHDGGHRLCVAEASSTFGPVDGLTGCPPEAEISCGAATLTRPSAVGLDGAIVASAQATSAGNPVCRVGGQVLDVGGMGAGSIFVKSGPTPAAASAPVMGMSLAGTPEGALRGVGVCRAGAAACEARRLYQTVDPAAQIPPSSPTALLPGWFGAASVNLQEENTTAFATPSGWAAAVFRADSSAEGLAWSIGASTPAEPQISFPVPPYGAFYSASDRDGRILVSGASTGSLPGAPCEGCTIAFGFVAELDPDATTLTRSIVHRVGGEQDCGALWIPVARPMNDGSVIVGGSYTCGELDFAAAAARGFAAGAVPASYLYKTTLPAN